MTGNSENIPVICLSLDNCIVKGDSLNRLASFLKGYGLRHGKLGLVRRIYTLCHRRNNFDISRRRFKFELMRTLRSIKNKGMTDRFVSKLQSTFNGEVIGILNQFREKGGKIAIVTSSPAEYADQVGEIIGADICIATPSLSEFRRRYPHDPIDYEECMGTEKISRLQEWINANGYELHTIVSGEPDELPLILLPDVDTRYIVAPSKNMRRNL